MLAHRCDRAGVQYRCICTCRYDLVPALPRKLLQRLRLKKVYLTPQSRKTEFHFPHRRFRKIFFQYYNGKAISMQLRRKKFIYSRLFSCPLSFLPSVSTKKT
jgi:hypothetical protein